MCSQDMTGSETFQPARTTAGGFSTGRTRLCFLNVIATSWRPGAGPGDPRDGPAVLLGVLERGGVLIIAGDLPDQEVREVRGAEDHLVGRRDQEQVGDGPHLELSGHAPP